MCIRRLCVTGPDGLEEADGTGGPRSRAKCMNRIGDELLGWIVRNRATAATYGCRACLRRNRKGNSSHRVSVARPKTAIKISRV